MNSTDAIIGFDLRKLPRDIDDAEWDEKRREKFLLNPNIAYPLSVDDAVWPRIDDEAVLRRIFMTEEEIVYTPLYYDTGLKPLRLQLCDIEVEDFEGNVLVAVSICGQNSFSLFLKSKRATDTQFPITVDHLMEMAWAFLGYDVGDSLFFSGLSNCGFTEKERKELYPAFAGDLNAFGLFRDEARATVYRKVTDRRVHEHAPFFVFGLFALGLNGVWGTRGRRDNGA